MLSKQKISWLWWYCMCPVVIISCFQMMDSIILWSAFLPVKVICPETLLLSSSSFSNDEWWFTDIVLLFVCSFMFVVFDSVVDCSHHSLPSPLLPPPGLSSLQKRPLGNGNGKSFKDFLRVTNKNHRLVCGKKCPSWWYFTNSGENLARPKALEMSAAFKDVVCIDIWRSTSFSFLLSIRSML